MAVKKVKWSNLLQLVENHLVVPVVGPELSVLQSGEQNITLYDTIARELIRTLDWSDEEPPPGSSLDSVVRSYLRDPENKPRPLYLSVFNILNKPKQPWPTPEPLRQLAAITHFDVYVTITFDSLLEQAINEVRFGGVDKTSSRAYSIGRPPSAESDLPLAYKPAYSAPDRPPPVPAVYHLFGKAGVIENDYTLREEDVLQFCQRLQSRDRRPSNLFDVLNGRDLLVLGSGFPGWLTRFFLATTKQDQLFNGDASGILADRSSPQDQDLVLFLERNRTDIYLGDAVAFVDELYRRWQERFPDAMTQAQPESVAPSLAPDLPEFKENMIFISYAREDQKHAEAIRDALTMANLHVWFDHRDLEPGDDFKLKILQAIEQCSVFVPVISRDAISTNSRFLYREWNKAQDRAQDWKPGTRFIQPVVVDDTRTDELPEFRDFQAANFVRLEDGRVPPIFVEKMIGTIRKLRSKAIQR